MSKPVASYLARFPQNKITIADMVPQAARAIADAHPQCATAVHLDAARDPSQLDKLVSEHDLVISMLPYTLHAAIAKLCIKHRRNMVTASYINPQLKELHEDAVRAGVTILNECGLDPGIDHCSALKVIDEVKAEGGKIESFESWCGGLPAPEDSANPLGYKFSWSPRGVLLAARNSARFLRDGEVVETPADKLFATAAPMSIYPGFSFEGYPNRDSLAYKQVYNLPDVRNMIRGTLRFTGYCHGVDTLKRAGLLSIDAHPALAPGAPPMSWPAFLRLVCPQFVQETPERLCVLAAGLSEGTPEADKCVSLWRWLGLLDEKNLVPQKGTPLDAVCAEMEKRMQYGKGERDLVVLHHIFGVRTKDGRRQQRTSTLVAYGDPKGFTAMAKTVGTPAGIAAHLITSGGITRRGVIAPFTPDIYLPMLRHLEEEGIKMDEKTL